MKGKSSSRAKGMEVMERPTKSTEESHLSGAHIRSLVKHLRSSSRSKDQTLNLKSTYLTLEGQLDEAPPPPSPPPFKKQVRRRLHTSRPYQERILNMAEARREIVNALKVHRASMKQANYPPPPPPPTTTTTKKPNLNPSSDIDQPNVTYPSLACSYPTLASVDNLNLSLPNYQPLGLNLNFQGFNNIDTSFCTSNINDDPLIQPLSPLASYSSFPSYSSPPTCANAENDDMKMHVAMDEKEMEEIRLIGEKHDIEWNDMVNLVTSAWWSNFLEVDDSIEGNGFRAFDDYCSQDASLPRLDTGEIDRMDDECLS